MIVAASAGELAAKVPAPANGTTGIVRVGAGADAEDIVLAYHAGVSRWLEIEEHELVRGNDVIEGTVFAPFTSKQQMLFSDAFGTPGTTVAPLYGYTPPAAVAAKFAAGLGLIYRHAAWLNQSSDLKATSVGFVAYEIDPGDATPAFAPAAAWAESAYLSGGSAAGLFGYQWATSGYADLLAPGGGAVAAPAKSSLHIAVSCLMAAGATAGGSIRDYQAFYRWATP